MSQTAIQKLTDRLLHELTVPGCLQVELIMVQHDASGAFQGRFSMGWAQLPLFSADSKVVAGSASQLLVGQGAIEPVMAGTPRYLLFRSEMLSMRVALSEFSNISSNAVCASRSQPTDPSWVWQPPSCAH
jgi:hypothetical protein